MRAEHRARNCRPREPGPCTARQRQPGMTIARLRLTAKNHAKSTITMRSAHGWRCNARAYQNVPFRARCKGYQKGLVTGVQPRGILYQLLRAPWRGGGGKSFRGGAPRRGRPACMRSTHPARGRTEHLQQMLSFSIIGRRLRRLNIELSAERLDVVRLAEITKQTLRDIHGNQLGVVVACYLPRSNEVHPIVEGERRP